MPKYLVGSCNPYNFDGDAPFEPDLIVTAGSPDSRPTLVEPFNPNDVRSVALAMEISQWIHDSTDDARRTVREIWSTKTVVADMDGNFLPTHYSPETASEPKAARRHVNRG